jgi:hypothetical protein
MSDDDRTRELEQRLETLERRLARRQRGAGIESAFWAMMHNLFPAEARLHMKAAGREQLLAARSYLDHWIARLDAEENGAEAPRETIDIS